MKRNYLKLFEGLLFMLLILLVFLLVFETSIAIPYWLNPLGRLHPLILHFPIVLLLLVLLFDLFMPKEEYDDAAHLQKYSTILLLSGTLLSVLTAISGLFLSQEEGYNGDSLTWHKWSGSITSVAAYFYYAFRKKITDNKILKRVSASSLTIILILTGHFGATLTHGDNFIFESFTNNQIENVAFKDAKVYEHMVRPIFEAKCLSCHNSKKMKGELLLNTIENIKKGGKTGHLWQAGNSEKSLLLERVFLDFEEKKHMPPNGKTQLTPDEKRILRWWIQKNADFNLKASNLPTNDSLGLLARKIFSQNKAVEKYDFDKAEASLIKSLNNEYRVVNSISKTSPALDVTLFNSKGFDPNSVNDLLQIKEQVVSLNLSKTPISDLELKTIGQLTNLKKLNLNFTKITGKGLQNLKTNTKLNALTLAGISLKISDLKILLNNNKSLESLSLWNTDLDQTSIESFKKTYPNIEFIVESELDVLKLNLPFLKNKPIVFKESLNLEIGHPIAGVTIRFTADNTEPDSVKSPIFIPGKSTFTKTTTINAKAYKKGWYGSDMATFTVFKNSYKPDSVVLLSKLNRVHPANGNATFFDQTFGTFNANSPAWANNWAGFKNNDMELLMVYKNAVSVSEIGLNFLIEIETGIFPAHSIEIWAGSSEKTMKLISINKPSQPTALSRPYIKPIFCKIPPTKATHFKLVAKPINPIPDWHPSKGKVSLFLVDEIIVN